VSLEQSSVVGEACSTSLALLVRHLAKLYSVALLGTLRHVTLIVFCFDLVDFLSALLPDGVTIDNCKFGECADKSDAPGALDNNSVFLIDFS
jgi:hypothetical protein